MGNIFELCARTIEYEISLEENYKLDNAIQKVFTNSNQHIKEGKMKNSNQVLRTGIKMITNAHEKIMQSQTEGKGR